MRRSLIVSIMAMFILVIFHVSIVTAADIPKTLNYQGTLTDNTGQSVSGTKQITFHLYSAASGGTALWTEVQTVTVTDGRFSVVLGSTTPLEASIFTGETFLGIQIGTDTEMAPRQKLTSVGYAFKALEVVNLPNIPDPIPSRVIVMWYGAINEIPAGWALCNGANGTPDLQDRFVVGAGKTYAKGANGGEAKHTLTPDEMPSHTHTQNAHTHSTNAEKWYGNRYATNWSSTGPGDDVQIGFNDASNSYEIATNQNTGGDAAHENMPPYFALAYIMKL